jgi:hypothetical protein
MPFEPSAWYKRRVSHFGLLNADALLKLRLRECCQQQVLHSLWSKDGSLATRSNRLLLASVSLTAELTLLALRA